MAMWITINFNFGQRNEPDTRLVSIEGLEPKAEQVQPPVQQPDAALCTNEPPGSAAGNPDGDSLEAFEAWIGMELKLAWETPKISLMEARASDGEVTVLRRWIERYKRQGAA